MTSSLYYNNSDSVKKKLINRVIFNKSYIKNLEVSKTAYNLDNYYNSSFLKLKKNEIFFPAQSINSAPNLFINKLNKEIKFQINTCVFTKRELNLQKFYKTLVSAKELTPNFNTLIFLKIVKGGFKCYYFGVIGFLPRTQANKSFKNLVDSIKISYSKQKLNSLLLLFSKPNSNFKPNLIRVSPFTLSNLCVYPTFRKKKFSGLSKKSKLFLNDINVVFVFKTTK